MLWHHLIVNKQIVRSIYESFGEDARPIIAKAIVAFPDWAWQIAHSTLIGESEPYEHHKENIISVYIPGPPEWYDGIADHHCMKLHMHSGVVEWKILWTPPYKEGRLKVEGDLVWVGQNYDPERNETDEYHEYYDNVSRINKRDLIGYTCTNDLEIKHTKIYVHPHWMIQGDKMEATWAHLKGIDFPVDVSPVDHLRLTKGNQWIN